MQLPIQPPLTLSSISESSYRHPLALMDMPIEVAPRFIFKRQAAGFSIRSRKDPLGPGECSDRTRSHVDDAAARSLRGTSTEQVRVCMKDTC